MKIEEKISSKSSKYIIIDAQDKILGRLATQVASLLMGKGVVGNRNNKLMDIKVVVMNTDKVALTGNKEITKVYRHYSGYPSGIKSRNVAEQRKRDSRVIIEQAVFGMLPKNKLRARMMTNLVLFKGSEHPY
jgi:large subunit ribosomal protein L13